MASVRLIFLLSLGRGLLELAALLVPVQAWIPGLGPAGAETLLVIDNPPIVDEALLTLDEEGTDGEIVGTFDDEGFSDVALPLLLPTAYMPILCALSPSGPEDESVDVPVVPELGDCCLKNQINNPIY